MRLEICKLISMLITDGGLSPHGKYSWELYFRNNSEALNKLFRSTVHSLFGIFPKIQIRKDGTIQQRIRSKEIGESLLYLTNTFRTLSCKKHPICGKYRESRIPCLKCNQEEYNSNLFPIISFPKEIEENYEFTTEFLKIAFSCDGGVSFYKAKRKNQSWLIRKIFIDSVNPSVLSYYQKLLNKNGFNIKTYGSQIRLQELNMIDKFNNEIGFIEKVLVGKDSKYWTNITKNNLLKKILKSYKSFQ